MLFIFYLVNDFFFFFFLLLEVLGLALAQVLDLALGYGDVHKVCMGPPLKTLIVLI